MLPSWLIFGAAVAFTRRGTISYRGWKSGRATIPAYRNWRGDWVPDLWVRRIERTFWTVLVAFMLSAPVIAYYFVTALPPVPDCSEQRVDSDGAPIVSTCIDGKR